MKEDSAYEVLTKELYESLLANEGLTIDVKHDVKIKGKAFEHQIDVYWEYKIAGIIHKVAIECKNYNSNVPVGKVRDFYGVLSDIGNINGIMVSKVGFQKGAKKYAEHYGINLKVLRKPIDEDWKGRIKTIVFKISMVVPQIKNRKINLDEEWIKENIPLPEKGDFTYEMSGMADEIWIYNELGEKVKNFHQLDQSLPHKMKKGKNLTHKYEFENGFLEIEKFGKVKITSLDYLFDVNVGEPEEFKIEGSESAKAIIKDAISGEILFFDKDGGVH